MFYGETDLLNTLDLIWERLEEVDLCATAPQGEDKHDPERLTGCLLYTSPSPRDS